MNDNNGEFVSARPVTAVLASKTAWPMYPTPGFFSLSVCIHRDIPLARPPPPPHPNSQSLIN